MTNFASAHDTDGSMTIDFHFDKDGNPVTDLDDSIWSVRFIYLVLQEQCSLGELGFGCIDTLGDEVLLLLLFYY